MSTDMQPGKIPVYIKIKFKMCCRNKFLIISKLTKNE